KKAFEHSLDSSKRDPAQSATDLSAPEQNALEQNVASSSAWAVFKDDTLDALRQQALEHNTDIAIAYANWLRASTTVRDAQLDFWPQPLTTAQFDEKEDSMNEAFPAVHQGEAYQSHRITQSFNWELDVVGRVRRLSESARAALSAQTQELMQWKMLTQAEVVRYYFILRGTQSQLASTRTNAQGQRETWELTQSRFEAGAATPIDVQRAKSQYYATLAALPPLERTIVAAQQRLAVLTGVESAPWRERLKASTPLPVIPDPAQWDITPQRILQHRPDVLAAEARLHQATADIGVVQAQWYPRLTLLADAGLASENVSDLGDGDSVFTLLGVGVQWSGLGVFRVKNRVKRAKALAEQAHAEYKKVVLLAFEEVENALVNHRSTRAITQSLALSAEAARSAARLARERYEGGVIGFIEVLDAEKRLLDLESQLAAAKTQEALAVVALMRSVALQ
ncbi:MAG: efflux transporter outer membrane subunit, partial [Gammaproteobacteria bacterium]